MGFQPQTHFQTDNALWCRAIIRFNRGYKFQALLLSAETDEFQLVMNFLLLLIDRIIFLISAQKTLRQ